MQNKKKVAIVLLIAFAMTMLVPVSAFAASFKDISSDHWAIQQIDRMNARGIIGGYEDGTVRANNPVTQFEAVLMASRMMGLEYDASKSKGTYLPFAYPSWDGAYNSAVAAYEAGLIDAADFNHSAPASREWITKLLIKVLDAEKQLGTGTSTMPFSDKGSISSKYQNYVQLAYDKNLIGGYTDGTFKPANTVTRAELAAFLCRAENQMDVKASNVVLGTVNSINGVSIVITGKDGNNRTLYATTNSNLYDATGNKIGVNGLKENDSVYAVFTNSLLNYLEVRTNVDYSISSTVVGKVTSIIAPKTTIIVTDENDKLCTIVLDEKTAISYDNDSTKLDFSDLTVNMKVRVKVDKNTQIATDVVIEQTSDGQKSGSIYNIDVYENLITMKEKTGLVTYRMSKNIDVSISGMLTATPSSLKEGDQATYIVSNGVMVAIAVGNNADNYGGNAVVTSIDTTNLIVTYKTNSGELKAAYYTKGQTVTFTDGTEGTISDLMIGDHVTMTVAANNVVAIKVIDRNVTDGAKGTLYSLDTKGNTIIITTAKDEMKPYILADNVKVTLYGESASLSALEKGMNVELTVSNGKVSRIKANDLVEGTVKTVNTTAKTISITTTDGKSATYDVASDVVINYYKSTSNRLSSIVSGDKVSLRLVNSEVTTINVTNEVAMTVYNVYPSSGYFRLVDENSNYKSAYVDEIDLFVDEVRTTDLNKVSVGDSVTATFMGNNITKVEVSGSGMKGQVIAVNVSKNTITIKPFNSGESKEVMMTNGSYITKDGSNSTNISTVSVGDRIVVTPVSGTAKAISVLKSKTDKVRYVINNQIQFSSEATANYYCTVPGVYCHYSNSSTTFTLDKLSTGTVATGEYVTVYYTDKNNVYEVEWDK